MDDLLTCFDNVKKSKFGVYCFKNKITGQVYIGSSRQLNIRKYQHLRLLRMNAHNNKHMQNSYNKYGELSFEYSVLEYEHDKDCLFEREQYFINLYDACNREKGFNISPDAKIPILSGVDNHNYGKRFSAEHCQRISKSLRESPNIKIRKGKDHPMFGKKHTAETGRKIAEANRRRPRESYDAIRNTMRNRTRGKNNFAKAVVQETTDGLFVATFDSLMSAQDKTGVRFSNISSVIRGQSKTAGGYVWRYAS